MLKCGLFSRIVWRNKDGLPLGSLSGIGAVSLRTVKARLPKREACVESVGSLAALFEGIRKGCGLFSRIVGRNKDGFPLGSLSGVGAVSLRTVKARLPKREACVESVDSLAASKKKKRGE